MCTTLYKFKDIGLRPQQEITFLHRCFYYSVLKIEYIRVASLRGGFVFVRSCLMQGPRVIIVGEDSGKSTLAKMLLSWAAKDGCKPTFVDLNVGQSSITITGTIAATTVEMPVDPVEGLPLHKALVHYFGHSTVM